MQYYIDIKCKTTKSNPLHVAFNNLFHKLHLCLAKLKSENIGFSYPKRDELGLGDTIRLHSDKESLIKFLECGECPLDDNNLLFGKVSPTPATTTFEIVMRERKIKDGSRYRRLIRRGNFTDSEARALRIKFMTDISTLPYVEIPSSTSGQRAYRRYFKISKACSASEVSTFNTFGESKNGATVPSF